MKFWSKKSRFLTMSSFSNAALGPWEPLVQTTLSPLSRIDRFGSRRYKGKINLRLEPSSLFPEQTDHLMSVSEALPFDRGVGPLTGVMLRSAHNTRQGNAEEFRPPYGPLTSIMLESGGFDGAHTSRMQQFMHPFILAPFEDMQMSPLPAQPAHSLGIHKTSTNGINFMSPNFPSIVAAYVDPSSHPFQLHKELEPLPSSNLSVVSNIDINEECIASTEPPSPSGAKFDWPDPKEVYLNEMAPATHVGANYYERKALTNLDRLTTTREMTLSVLDKIDFNRTKRTRAKKQRFPAPKLADLAADFKKSSPTTNRTMCRFAGCCFSQVGFLTKTALRKHVEQNHFTERITCPWCNNVYSRSDAATRHIKRKHSMSQRKEIVSKKARDQRSLIANGFVLSSSKFVPPMRAYYATLTQGSLRPYSRREKVGEETSSSESEDSRVELSSRTPSKEPSRLLEEEITQENASPFLYTSGNKSFLQDFVEREVNANAKINYVLATDAYKDHVRDLLAGTINSNSTMRKYE